MNGDVSGVRQEAYWEVAIPVHGRDVTDVDQTLEDITGRNGDVAPIGQEPVDDLRDVALTGAGHETFEFHRLKGRTERENVYFPGSWGYDRRTIRNASDPSSKGRDK